MSQLSTTSNFTTVDASGGYYVNGTQIIDNTGAYIGGVLPADLALAQGSVFVGNASNVAAAVSAKTSGQILVGSGTTLASVAVSGDATLSSAGALTVANGAITRAKMSAPASLKTLLCNLGTVAVAAGAYTAYFRVSATGTLSSIGFVTASNLATSDTNYITFTCTNVTAGKTLFANDATEKTTATGGTAITADQLRYFTLTGTTADLNVTAGDLIKLVATVTGTLANTVLSTTYSMDLTGTT
jgi:hypothetical protein